MALIGQMFNNPSFLNITKTLSKDPKVFEKINKMPDIQKLKETNPIFKEALKDPDLLGKLLFSIEYKDTNLLDYLNRHLRKACQFGLNPRFHDVEHSFDLLNCCEAIIDCSSELKLPSRQKNKVKEKARKRQNERDFE